MLFALLIGMKHGRPPRWEHWDYSFQGYYFLTIIVKNRECHLGEVVRDKVHLTAWGKIVHECWLTLSQNFQNAVLDEMVIMPNHLHAIIKLNSNTPGIRRPLINQGPTETDGPKFVPLMSDPRMLLGKIVRFWKAKSTRIIRVAGLYSFAWQERFYDHVIRHEKSLYWIREYIRNNPSQWSLDENNPLPVNL